ncbi:alcohol oxidase [Mycena belliarum]|uniref:Alcohol oxidase n=1 Tax=Mycena belliarum TaxID=1033014 RepID=A0AAD6TUW6_9AGAR|nr:alcohol oxidase [Mycena belliae]
MWPFGSGYPALSVDQAGGPLGAKSTKSYDYIVVGGGAAGCCLASRLSEDPSVSVLVLERGRVHDTWYSRIPMISGDTTSSATPIVRSPSAPLAGAQGQTLDVVHAEVLGGGSAVNAMLVTRGAVGDFDHWAALGHPSWDYASLRPYFVKCEKSLSQRSEGHGYSGPLINQTFPEYPFAVQHRVKAAALSLGFADVGDLNAAGAPADAFATLDAAIDHKMRRVSACHAFLPARIACDRRQRLCICTQAVATRIVVEGGVAVGVVFESNDESVPGAFFARARKEVVVSCGAIGSPQLLLLSGIGPAGHLKELNIDVVCDLPGVGAHLQDHVGLPLMYEVPRQDTLHDIENKVWKGVLELGKYFVGLKSSIMSIPVTPIAIFAHSSHLDDKTSTVTGAGSPEVPGDNRPDLEIMPIPHWCSEPPSYKITNGVFSFLLCNVQPKSLGSVRLASSNPHARPVVELGFLTDSADLIPLRKGVKLALRLADAMRAQGYPMRDFQVPASEADADLDAFARAYLRTSYHYTSSCRMARRADGGVVDDALRVHGVQRLRVCDASVFPWITSGHTMAPVLAVAEKCADLLKQETVEVRSW